MGGVNNGRPSAVPFDDATVLRIARAYERVTDWHTRRPDPARWRL
jgi:hypothetical protein